MSAAVAVAGSSLVIRRQTFVGYSAGSRVFAAAAAAAVADVLLLLLLLLLLMFLMFLLLLLLLREP